MPNIFHPSKQKVIVVAVAATVSFLGLQAVSRAIDLYQTQTFVSIAAYVYLFLVFWQSFIFDLHLKKTYTWGGFEKSFASALKQRFRYMVERHHFLHYLNYLILPSIIYWSAIGVIFLNPFDYVVKQAVIIASSAALGVGTWYLKTVFYDHHNAHRNTRQIIFLVKLLASYLAFTAAFGLARYFGIDALTFALAVFALTYLLLHQAFFQHHFVSYKTMELLAICGLVMAETAAFIYLLWNVNYFSGALVIAAVYNTCWGLVQHKQIDRNLTREIVYEYLSVLFVIVVIVFSLTNFSQRVF